MPLSIKAKESYISGWVAKPRDRIAFIKEHPEPFNVGSISRWSLWLLVVTLVMALYEVNS